MRPYSFLAACLLFGSLSPNSHAETMYKCTDANGKIAYSDQACDGKAKVSKAFDVTVPAQDAAVAAQVARDTEKWKKADQESRERYRRSEREYEAEARRYASSHQASARERTGMEAKLERMRLDEHLRNKQGRLARCNQRRMRDC